MLYNQNKDSNVIDAFRKEQKHKQLRVLITKWNSKEGEEILTQLDIFDLNSLASEEYKSYGVK